MTPYGLATCYRGMPGPTTAAPGSEGCLQAGKGPTAAPGAPVAHKFLFHDLEPDTLLHYPLRAPSLQIYRG